MRRAAAPGAHPAGSRALQTAEPQAKQAAQARTEARATAVLAPAEAPREKRGAEARMLELAARQPVQAEPPEPGAQQEQAARRAPEATQEQAAMAARAAQRGTAEPQAPG